MTTDDLYLPLAFSLASSPDAYAVLAGAGVSKGAGLPSAWEIEVDLVTKIARQVDDPTEISDDNAEQWYHDRFGKPLTYSDLLEHLAQRPHERKALLHRYFEPSDDEDSPDHRAEPSRAHRAVAQLVKEGVVRVIVTMNFDRLFEQALRELGIEPTVVATEADAEGLGPLRLLNVCVIHLHGDYRQPTSMRNTGAELDGYPPHMDRLLRQVIAEYGLLVAGWSVQHDAALRDAVKACCTRRFTTLSDSKIKKMRRRARNAALPEMDGPDFTEEDRAEFRKAVTEAFGHINDQTFRSRMADLIADARLSIPNIVAGFADWPDAVSTARNLMAHQPSLPDHVDDRQFLDLLVALSYSITWVLRTNLLNRAGFDAATLQEGYGYSSSYGHHVANTRELLAGGPWGVDESR